MVKDGEVEEFASFDAALVTAKVVSKLEEAAEACFGRGGIKDAFLLVPEYWADAHVTAAREACRLAGLDVLKTICESKAAAAAYGLDKKLREEGTVLVCHLGGGTASATVLLFEEGVFKIMTERHSVYLGGRDFDQRIADYFVDRIKKKHNKDVIQDKVALARLRMASEHAKKALTNQDHVWVKVESLFDGVDFSEPLTRAKFEELNNDLFVRAIELMEKAVRDVEKILDIRKELIDEIVLVSGSSRIPEIQKLLKDYFDGKEPNMRLEPDEALSYGAALLTHPTAACYQCIAERRDFELVWLDGFPGN